MSFANRPDKVTCDAYSDATLENGNANGVYSRFTNRLTTPILNAKGIQLLNANFINPILQLNDAGQLVFYYYRSSTLAGIRASGNLRCIRLHPSTFVPASGFTNFVKNKYYNSVSELVADLNAASLSTGDSITYNPDFEAGDLTWSYNANTRKISVASTIATIYIAPAAADDPLVLAVQQGTTPFSATDRLKMNGFTSSSTYATATLQPFVAGQSMNARLGFAMTYTTRGLWWGTNSQQGCATATGVPQLTSVAIEADANPILIGAQNVNVYCSAIVGSGMDSLNGKNLLATVPLEAPALNVNSYTTSSVEKPALSVSNEIYELTFDMRDDYGSPVPFPPNYNTEFVISIYY
jgi:hypothetical protein